MSPPISWIDYVKQVHEILKKANPGASFKEALVQASKNKKKGLMGKEQPGGKSKTKSKKASKKKSKSKSKSKKSKSKSKKHKKK